MSGYNPLAIGGGGYKGLTPLLNPNSIIIRSSPVFDIKTTGGDTYDFTHNMGRNPDFVEVIYRCVTAQAPYAAGDEVGLGEADYSAGLNREYGTAIINSADGNTTSLLQGEGNAAGVVFILWGSDGSGLTPTNSSWRIYFKCYWITTGDVPDITRVGMVPLKRHVIANGDAIASFDLKQYWNDYESIVVQARELRCATDNTQPRVRLLDSNDTSLTDANYFRAYAGVSAGTASHGQDSAQTQFNTNTTGTTNDYEIINFDMEFNSENMQNSARRTQLWCRMYGINASPSGYHFDMFWTRTGSGETTNGFFFFPVTGNFQEGRIELYGRRKVA